MSDPTLTPAAPDAAGPDEPLRDAEAPVLDFSGPFDLSPALDPDEAHSDRGAGALIGALLPASFADSGFLLPDAAAAGRFAVRTIRGFQQAAGRPKRTRLIYCAGPDRVPPPAGLTGDDGIDILATDDPGVITGAITARTAGILIAPVRTGPTLDVLPGSLLAELRTAADEYGIALAFDETESGLCRTGMMWAHEWCGVSPDLMIVGAGLAGPAPLAAVLATRKLARGAAPPDAVDPALLPLAHVRLDTLLAVGFDAEVQSRAWALEDRLTVLSYQHRPVYTATAGLGLMQGLVCGADAAPLAERAAAHGLLTRPMGRVLGLLPPLTVSEAEIDAAAEILARIAAEEGKGEAKT
ncbi:aminotransferase class III-fold pyridoxal phosphate-dependent enzyme [Xanthobacter sediminis]